MYDSTGVSEEVISNHDAGGSASGVTGSVARDTSFDDTIRLSGKLIDAATRYSTGEVVDSLTVQGGSARFLLTSPSLALANEAISNLDKQ